MKNIKQDSPNHVKAILETLNDPKVGLWDTELTALLREVIRKQDEIIEILNKQANKKQ